MMHRPIRSGERFHPEWCRCREVCQPSTPATRREFTATDAGWIGLAAFAAVIAFDFSTGAHGLRALFGL